MHRIPISDGMGNPIPEEGTRCVPGYDKAKAGYARTLTRPTALGESCNTVFTYGYDSVTAMQETKVSLCRLRKVV